LTLLWPVRTVATEVATSPILSEVAGSGWVSSHSARAMTVGSIPAFFHRTGFIATAMDLAMMAAAQRHRTFRR